MDEGCFVNGQAGKYMRQPFDVQSNGGGKYHKVFGFEDVAVEIRNTIDPYTVFSALEGADVADLSIFFWLSMVCLLAAFFMILTLAFYYKMFID